MNKNEGVEDRELILKLQAEVAELRNQCAVQELRIADLERERAERSRAQGVFDRTANRIGQIDRTAHVIHDDTLISDASVESEKDAPWPQSLIDDDVLFGGGDDDHRETVAGVGHEHDDSILADLNVRSTLKPALVRMFVAMDDKFPGNEYPLDKPLVTIGRGKDCDIRLEHLLVSRNHARLRTGARHTVIEDAGSKNGITVNSRAVDRAALRNGDIVSLGGKLDFQYVELELPPH